VTVDLYKIGQLALATARFGNQIVHIDTKIPPDKVRKVKLDTADRST
jgi:hypothetical protein